MNIYNKKVIYYQTLIGLSLNICFANCSVNQYINVGNLVLEAESKEIKPISIINQDNQKEKNSSLKNLEELNEDLNAFDAPLDKIRKKEITFNCFANSGNLKIQESKIAEDYILRELSIIIGSETHKNINLFNHLDQTITTYGSAMLARMLAEPITCKKTLTIRQNIIKALLEDEQLIKRLEHTLKAVNQNEDAILGLWEDSSKLVPELKARVYLGFKNLNKSPKVLQALRNLNLGSVGFSIGFMGLSILSYTGLALVNNKTPITLFALAYDALLVFAMKAMISELKLTNKICYALHGKAKGAAKTFEALETIYYAIRKKTNFTQGIKTFTYLSKFINDTETISTDLDYLKQLLAEPIFNETASWSSNMGKPLAAYEYLTNVKDQLVPLLETVGEIDAYLAIAKLFKQFQNEKVKYTFVEFVENDTPYVQLKDVWNPLIDINSVVTEDIAFGTPSCVHNIMLTGPHGGGKSTFMKSVAYCIWLGQVYGIAPCSIAKCTIFDQINTYVNIKEDLASGQSTFMAEKKRVDEISKMLLSLKENEKAFTIMDEVFKGTMEDEGAYRLYKFGLKIAPIKQNLSIIATHFRKPAKLEEDTQEFTNYHVGLEEQPDNSFIRTFKLIKGKNEWWFNDREKRSRYIDWLTSIN